LKEEIAPYIEKKSGSSIGEPLLYSLLAGGKRIRPVLALLCGGVDLNAPPSIRRNRSLYAAFSLEAIHTYSLIHDDLPSMDDDEMRRGRPSCHMQFNEWKAILAGDALNTLAFDLLLESVEPDDARRLFHRVRILSDGAGIGGMICGQMLDLAAEKEALTFGSVEQKQEYLKQIHLKKTAAMMQASCEMGASIGGCDDRAPYSDYGRKLGLLFQIADDILDVVGDSQTLGKTAGKDAASGKLTYPALYGLERSRHECETLVEELRSIVDGMVPGPDAERDFRPELRELPDLIVTRKS